MIYLTHQFCQIIPKFGIGDTAAFRINNLTFRRTFQGHHCGRHGDTVIIAMKIVSFGL